MRGFGLQANSSAENQLQSNLHLQALGPHSAVRCSPSTGLEAAVLTVSGVPGSLKALCSTE